jgi:hypothetical protein
MVFALIAPDIPLLKIVRLRKRLRVVTNLVCSGESVLLSASDVVGLAAGSYFTVAIVYADDAGGAVGTYVHAIFSGPQNRKGRVGSIDLVIFVVLKMQNAKIRGTLCNLNLNSLVV